LLKKQYPETAKISDSNQYFEFENPMLILDKVYTQQN